MSNILLNNYKTALVSSIGAADTQIYVGHSLPSLGVGDYYLLTLFARSGAEEFNWEIVKVTVADGTTLTVVRGQEGTTARSWDADSLVEMRLTAGQVSNKADVSHTHAIADVTGLQTALDGKAATVHTHTVSDVTGLQAVLDGKLEKNITSFLGDVNTLTLTGNYKVTYSGSSNLPNLNNDYIVSVVSDGTNVQQTAYRLNGGDAAFSLQFDRLSVDGGSTWTTWQNLAQFNTTLPVTLTS
jgi:hypothetical protein